MCVPKFRPLLTAGDLHYACGPAPISTEHAPEARPPPPTLPLAASTWFPIPSSAISFLKPSAVSFAAICVHVSGGLGVPTPGRQP